MRLFKKRKYLTVSKAQLQDTRNKTEQTEDIPIIPDGMWIKCDSCGKILYKKDVDKNFKTCQYCNGNFRMTAIERLELIMDKDGFKEFDKNLSSLNPLDFPDYESKVNSMKEKTGISEGVITGEGTINGNKTIIAVMDSNFMMGSMGSAVGEKITRAVETATKAGLPIIIFTTSGGARMQEGIFSLMQMAKVSAALSRHSEAGLLYITVLTDPTTGGVTASFAMLGDIILSEPKALIGFAGRRVIEQTIKQKLPEDFQTAEFLLEHGFIDKIVKRENMKEVLGNLLDLHCKEVI